MYRQTKNAFTLVELIVVITILAILGTIAFISLQGYSKQARDSRRVSDISNIRTSLEMYSLNSGKYPIPDEGYRVTYNSDLLRTQGIIGDNVTQNLSNNLSEKPTDPLHDIPYIYSTTYSGKEYELLGFYEGDVSKKLLIDTYAANIFKPKITGNYNGIFVKTANNIIPTPSIINSEINGGDIVLGTDTIKSQVLSNRDNFPAVNIAGVENLTGQLNIIFVATGTIDATSSDTEKISVINTIQEVYINSELSNYGIYANIINTDDEKKLAEELILNSSNSVNMNSQGVVNGVCGIANNGSFTDIPNDLCLSGMASIVIDNGEGNTYNWTCNGNNGGASESCFADHEYLNYPGCDSFDITYGDYTIAACNLGTNISGQTTSSYGDYYQFGRNEPYPVRTNGESSLNYYDWLSPGGINNGSANNWGVLDIDGTSATFQNSTTENKLKLQGPCAKGYHVPTQAEWQGIMLAGGWDDSSTISMMNNLKLPLAGLRMRYNSELTRQSTGGNYWSSSPRVYESYYFYINNTSGFSTNYTKFRSYGMPIRCFKN